ncbi:MAG: NADP-dependent succinic semialdehyde dehydrogenase [Thermoleophilia bacterium]
MAIATTNPATGVVERTFEPLNDHELERRLAKASEAFAVYRRTTFAERASWMVAAAGILDEERERAANLMTREMGKTIAASRAEAQKSAKALRFYAERAEDFLADEPANPADVGAQRAFARYEPLGPVLAVMPWNFPLWQVIRFAAPALMAGNVGLLKHASNVPQTSLYIEDLFLRAGFPEGVFQSLLLESMDVERVLRDPRVRAATLTGSEPAGRSVGSIAGEEIKPSVLELGGSDPFVVMPSADLERAAEVGVVSRCLNNGQSCISAKRFILHEDIAESFLSDFVERMARLRVGDPQEETTDVGPLVSEQARQTVEELVADARERGARVLCGGERVEGAGWYYLPTVLAGITQEMRVFSEEVFAPVATVFTVGDIEEALELANATSFGLGANAWTTSASEQERFVAELEAGQVFINGMTTSFPELPFGGVKNSGYGRELSAHGIREFCNLKTVWICTGREGARPGVGRCE